MAAPPTVTAADISGDYVMNKGISDDFDAILSLQGISWFLRKGISYATVTQHIKHYTAPAADSAEPPVKFAGREIKDGLEHIDIPQTVSGGLQGTTELRILDGTKRTHEDHVFWQG